MRHILWHSFIFFLTLTSSLQAQRTAVFTDAYAPIKEGIEWFELSLYQQAQRDLTRFLDEPRHITDHLSQIKREQAGLIGSQSAIRAGDPLAERKILEFARSTSPDPMGNQALFEAANYFFNAREYGQAVHFYGMVNQAGLGERSRVELAFKKGYCHFVQKQFQAARQDFGSIRDKQGDYYYPANYYFGMTQFFEGRYEDALAAFRRVERSPRYEAYIPYIISQILFAQGKYDELIAYAAPKTTAGRIENRMEIEQLLGRAHFEKGDYAAALPHLTYYADRNTTMPPADFYQLGYSQYRAGQYKLAIKSLEPLTRTQDLMGQNALFILGDSYLKTGQRVEARNAFMQASRMNHDAAIAEDALFQYAKLSYEMRADREAIQALAAIPESSRHYTEAQSLLGDLLIKTRETDFALEYLGKAPLRTPQLKEAYQKVHYQKAVQHVRQNDLDGAIPFLKKSMSSPIDPLTHALAAYLLGDVHHRQQNYQESIAEITKYQTLVRTLPEIPEVAMPYMAHYIQGYNHLKLGQYRRAAGFFQDAVAGIKRDAHRLYSARIKNNILGDAIIRTGDCYFKINEYRDALRFYDDAIQNKIAGFHYARFQKGLILGLQGKPFEKIVEMEQLVAEFPNSDYADDALYEIGTTLMEMGRFQEANKPFHKLINDYGKRSNLVNAARLKLGLISYNQGDLQEAIRLYKQVLEHNPEADERVAALSALEEIYVRDLSSPDDYAAILEKSGVNLSEAARDSLNFKSADNLYQSGQYDKAIQAYTRYLERFPNGLHALQAYYRRGECFTVNKQYLKALEDYSFVISRGKSRYYEDALGKAALISYNYSQDYARAFGYYREWEAAATNESARFDAQLGAMRSAYRAGLQDDVLAYGEKVSRNPQAGDAHRGQAQFYLGKVQYDRKQYDAALNNFQKVQELLSDDLAGEAHYLIANIYFQRRQLEAARTQCLQSNQKIPGQDYWVAKCILLLADIFIDEKDLFNARAALEGLLDNYFGDEDIRRTAREKLDYIQVLENQGSRLRAPLTNDLLDMQEESDRKR
jgi:TolA-binding protein